MHTIDYTVTLTSPLHHGAGSAGNTSLLRTEEVVNPADGSSRAVPFVSGNSLRHQLREALAWHLVTTLAVAEGSLSKASVDLLWSGGAVTTTGAQVSLDTARRVEEHFPALGLLGYAAQSDITAGTLRVSGLALICAENAWRLPPGLATHPHAARPAAAYRGDEFGTRHDVAGTPVDRYTEAVSGLMGRSTQMIYDLQTLKPGAVLSGSLSLTPGATPAHRRVLGAALELIAPAQDEGPRPVALGAKTAVGYGSGHLVATGAGDTAGDLSWWTGHVTDHGPEILALVGELGS